MWTAVTRPGITYELRQRQHAHVFRSFSHFELNQVTKPHLLLFVHEVLALYKMRHFVTIVGNHHGGAGRKSHVAPVEGNLDVFSRVRSGQRIRYHRLEPQRGGAEAGRRMNQLAREVKLPPESSLSEKHNPLVVAVWTAVVPE